MNLFLPKKNLQITLQSLDASFLILKMSGVVAFSCGLGETYVATNTSTINTYHCDACPKEIERKCKPVSTIHCNFEQFPKWTSVCKGCCGPYLPTPSPTITDKCQAGDIDQSFTTPAPLKLPWSCVSCEDGCKKKCEFWDAHVR
ncbi:hypothetical protein MKW94_023619 [Papaver nudicaule]|uniref:Uncharacterized protein n=1 Tax=Papaver nudicaule TaxID=74823 RepID=A0AA42AQG5_PAPNU|nr:hypothetical protein [Papaver nudicaule]